MRLYTVSSCSHAVRLLTGSNMSPCRPESCTLPHPAASQDFKAESHRTAEASLSHWRSLSEALQAESQQRLGELLETEGQLREAEGQLRDLAAQLKEATEARHQLEGRLRELEVGRWGQGALQGSCGR